MSDFAPGSFNIGNAVELSGPQFHEILGYLGLLEKDSKGVYWNLDSKVEAKVQRVLSWAIYKAGNTDTDSLSEKIYNLKRSVGTNATGGLLVDQLWEKTMFDRSFNRHLDKMESMKPTVQEEAKKETENLKTLPTKKTPIAAQTPIKETSYKPKGYHNRMAVPRRPVSYT